MYSFKKKCIHLKRFDLKRIFFCLNVSVINYIYHHFYYTKFKCHIITTGAYGPLKRFGLSLQ